MLPYVSVIVIAFNEQEYIAKCLDSLKSQNYPSELFEIILVDNGSTDRTPEIAREYLDVVYVKEGGKVGGLRNYGASLAKGEVLAFLDADCVAESNWLASISSAYKIDPSAVSGAECLILPNESWVPRAWFCLHREGRGEIKYLGASNFFISKLIFDQFKGFDENITTGEDAELMARVGKLHSLFYDSSLKVYHLGVPRDLLTFYKREVWHGLGAMGTFRVSCWDKPLMATLGFMLGCLISVLSLIFGSFLMFIVGAFLICGVLSVSVFYRRQFLRDFSHLLQLLSLFFVYYLARSFALCKIFLKIDQRHYSFLC